VFWCAELEQYFSFGNSYTYTSSLPNNGTFTALGQLFAAAFGGALTDATHSAAFQLAIWEVIYDSDRNLSGAGGFRVTGGNSATVALAQSWLNSMSNYADTYDIYLLSNGQHQNFITTRVPEPVTLLLFGTALLAMVLVTRRRGFAPIARSVRAAGVANPGCGWRPSSTPRHATWRLFLCGHETGHGSSSRTALASNSYSA